MEKIKSISQELESREVELCLVCGENPQRLGNYKTCSQECSKQYSKILNRRSAIKWNKSPKGKKRAKNYNHALKILRINHLSEFNKIMDELKC